MEKWVNPFYSINVQAIECIISIKESSLTPHLWKLEPLFGLEFWGLLGNYLHSYLEV